MSLSLVTNRTDENTYYNISDLNRVETATKYLADVYSEYGYYFDFSIKDDWAITDFPTTSEMARYLNNVHKLGIYPPNSVTLPDSMNGIDFEDANNIEKYLLEVEKIIDLMVLSFKHCNTFNCNQTVLNQSISQGRTWAELDAEGWTWAVWDTKTWYGLAYK